MVLDAVFGDPVVRTQAVDVATSRSLPARLVECTCSDLAVHRSRIEGRVRGIPGWDELTWADVERTRARCAPWTEDRLVLDAVTPFDDNLARALADLTD